MVIRMRHTKSHTANRRSHHALKATNFDVCSNCGAKKLRHRVCAACGQYNGKKVLDLVAKAEKKAKKAKAKAKEATK